MKTARYVRKPFEVDAIQVSSENMPEITTWCGGKMVEESIGKWYIEVDVERVLNERQRKAYVGDWVLKSPQGFKVFGHKAFKKSFQKKG